MAVSARTLWVAGTTAALVAGALVACTLNPQPLPPSELTPGENKDGADDASSPADAGAGFDRDAATPVPTSDAATDAGDAGDASDAGDGGDADAW